MPSNPTPVADETGEPHAKQSLRLWIRMIATTTIVEKAIRAHLKLNCDSTLPRFDVLAALDRLPGKVTMSQLSRKLLVSNGNVTGLISRLVEDGFVRRLVDPSDRRTQYVSLTPAGKEAFKRMATQHEDLVDLIFSEMSDSEMSDLLSLIAKLHHSVQHRVGAGAAPSE